MIVNAVLTQLVPPPVADGSGGFQSPAATQSLAIDCTLDPHSLTRRLVLDGDEIDVEATAYVPLPVSVGFATGQTLSFGYGGATVGPLRVLRAQMFVHLNGESHWQIFLKK